MLGWLRQVKNPAMKMLLTYDFAFIPKLYCSGIRKQNSESGEFLNGDFLRESLKVF